VAGFRIERTLGEGGMGTVYAATQLATGRQRALKLLNPTFAANPAYIERFVTEARVGSTIHSEHVVEVVGAGFDQDTHMPWLAMELLEGQNLEQMVERRGAIPANEVVSLFEQTCHGLAAAHRAGVVHRDLKPENVFVAQARRVGLPFVVKILDFGIAKLTQEALTAQGSQAIGTPFWMAPEQTQLHGRIGPHTDVWALGLLAFYTLAGKPYWLAAQPGAEGTLPAFINEAIVQQLTPPSLRVRQLSLGVALSPAFDQWFFRCLAREPDQRFGAVDECLEKLRVALSPASHSPTAMMGTMALDASQLPSSGGVPVTPAAHSPAPATPAPGGYGSQPGGYGSQPGGYGSQPGGYGSQPGGYGSQPGGHGSQPGAMTSPGYASYPGGGVAPPAAYDFSPPKSSNTMLFLGLAAVGVLALGAVGAIGIAIAIDASDDDDDESADHGGGGGTDDGPSGPDYTGELAECQAAIRAQNPQLAMQHANAALTARPDDMQATTCRDQAQAMQQEEGTFNVGVSALQRGDAQTAYQSFAALPPTSAYRSRPEVAQAASQLATQRLATANRELASDPARAYLDAQSVTFMQGVGASQVAQANQIVRDARRQVGTVYEGRVQGGGSCTISVRSLRNPPFNCRFNIRCGSRGVVYGRGTSGYNRCMRRGGDIVGARDDGMTHQDGDPAMTFDMSRRYCSVRDRGVNIEMQIALPGPP